MRQCYFALYDAIHPARPYSIRYDIHLALQTKGARVFAIVITTSRVDQSDFSQLTSVKLQR